MYVGQLYGVVDMNFNKVNTVKRWTNTYWMLKHNQNICRTLRGTMKRCPFAVDIF